MDDSVYGVSTRTRSISMIGEITNSGVAIMFTKDIEENERARTKARKLILEERERNATEQQQEPEVEPTGR